jgi:hypothetical protein
MNFGVRSLSIGLAKNYANYNDKSNKNLASKKSEAGKRK